MDQKNIRKAENRKSERNRIPKVDLNGMKICFIGYGFGIKQITKLEERPSSQL